MSLAVYGDDLISFNLSNSFNYYFVFVLFIFKLGK